MICARVAPPEDRNRRTMRSGASDERLAEQVKLQVDVQAKYSGYLKRQSEEIERQQRHEELRLPAEHRLRAGRRTVERGPPVA